MLGRRRRPGTPAPRVVLREFPPTPGRFIRLLWHDSRSPPIPRLVRRRRLSRVDTAVFFPTSEDGRGRSQGDLRRVPRGRGLPRVRPGDPSARRRLRRPHRPGTASPGAPPPEGRPQGARGVARRLSSSVTSPGSPPSGDGVRAPLAPAQARPVLRAVIVPADGLRRRSRRRNPLRARRLNRRSPSSRFPSPARATSRCSGGTHARDSSPTRSMRSMRSLAISAWSTSTRISFTRGTRACRPASPGSLPRPRPRPRAGVVPAASRRPAAPPDRAAAHRRLGRRGIGRRDQSDEADCRARELHRHVGIRSRRRGRPAGSARRSTGCSIRDATSTITAAFASRMRATSSSTLSQTPRTWCVDERDDGVGRRLDPFDQVGVERERRAVQSGHADHRSIPGIAWLRSAPLRSLHIGRSQGW